MMQIYQKMKIAYYLTCILSSSIALAQYEFPGYGDGEHNQIQVIAKEGSLATKLTKNRVTYKLIYTSQDSAFITANDKKIILIDKINIVPTHPIGMMVDILTSERNVMLLTINSQGYKYYEYVKEYPDEKAPMNDSYLDVPLPMQDREWKLFRCVDFIPRGMDPLLFGNHVKLIKKINLLPEGGIQIINDRNIVEKYLISDKKLILENVDYSLPVHYLYNRKLESVFIANIQSLTDEELMVVSKREFLTEKNEFKIEFNRVLSSMKNQNAAGEIRIRILNALKEQEKRR